MSIVAAYAVPHPPLIVPAVGRGQEQVIQDTIDAYRQVARRIAAHAPDTIVVTSPHAPLFRDCFHLSIADGAHGDMGQFDARNASLEVKYDREFAVALAASARECGIPVCSGMHDDVLDHATFVPLWFVDEAYRDYRLVRVGLSGLSPASHRSLGRCIAEVAGDEGKRVVLIASGDLSHKLVASGPYGFAPEGPVFDQRITQLFAAGDLSGLFDFDEAFADAAAECGLRSFQIMAGALEGVSCTHELLSYEGPFGVGYAVAAFEVEGAEDGDAAASSSDAATSSGDAAVSSDDAATSSVDASASSGDAAASSDVDPFVALARASVETFVRTGRPVARPAGLPGDLLHERAGVFVSLHEGDDLRGCIGTIEATTTCVADEIIRNGIAAASEDPRFPPVQAVELDYLSYSVDVLFPAQPIASPAELDPDRFGVIVTKGWRRGLLLPHLEGVDTVEQQLSIAKQKAGIDPSDDDVSLERFEVIRHDRGGEARRG